MSKRDAVFVIGVVLIAGAFSNFDIRWMSGVGGAALALLAFIG